MSDTNLRSGTDTGIATLGTIVIDCADPLALAEFYSKVSGWPVGAGSEPSWAELDNPAGGATVAFQRVDGDFNPPAWPGADHPQQFHLDFYVADLDEGERRVLEIGATRHEFQPGQSFRVFLDPAGHPFCLCKQ
jgi:catechol 2,3-dioxygenase-like lactoylglutathione lyase family enzyme